MAALKARLTGSRDYELVRLNGEVGSLGRVPTAMSDGGSSDIDGYRHSQEFGQRIDD